MRIRERKKNWPAALFCPIHHCLMRVRRVVENQQYRYCPVEGCRETLKTTRLKLPRPRTEAASLNS
ncbi:MAG TPA: hypothetical protein VGH74_11560 [Planctomycetaceae bacterium]